MAQGRWLFCQPLLSVGGVPSITVRKSRVLQSRFFVSVYLWGWWKLHIWKLHKISVLLAKKIFLLPIFFATFFSITNYILIKLRYFLTLSFIFYLFNGFVIKVYAVKYNFKKVEKCQKLSKNVKFWVFLNGFLALIWFNSLVNKRQHYSVTF